jgi:hypothetical protein
MLKRLAVAALPIAVVAIVVLPIALDQPFGTQTPRLMAWLYALRRWSPLVAAAGAAAMLVIAVRAWPRSRIVAQAALTAAVAVTIAAAWFARQNVFEWMFNPLPLPRPSFVAAGAASFLEPGDLVLAVRVGDDAAAYPIRQMAYHHLVNDRIGRTPAVVTY